MKREYFLGGSLASQLGNNSLLVELLEITEAGGG